MSTPSHCLLESPFTRLSVTCESSMAIYGRAAARLGGFGSSVLVTGAISLLVIPVVVRFAGEEQWASLAVGQTLGVLLAVVSVLGWAQLGPVEVARSDYDQRAQIYRDSLTLRSMTLFLTAPAAVIMAVLIAPGDAVVSATASLATLLVSCGASWFFIGEARPASLMLFDTIPRSGGMVIGAAVTAFTGSALWTAIGMLVGVLFAVALSSLAVIGKYGVGRARSPRELVAVLRRQLHGIGIGVFSTVYLSMPLLYLSATVPMATAQYALADRIKQQSMTALSPLAQTLQGWIPRATPDQIVTRVRAAATRSALFGALAGVAFICGAPVVSLVLGAGEVTFDLSLSIPLGIAFGLNVITLLVGSACLVPLDAARAVFWSAVAGTIVVIPGLVVGGSLLADLGVAWAVAMAQATVACVQTVALVTVLRAEPTRRPRPRS